MAHPVALATQKPAGFVHDQKVRIFKHNPRRFGHRRLVGTKTWTFCPGNTSVAFCSPSPIDKHRPFDHRLLRRRKRQSQPIGQSANQTGADRRLPP